MKKEKHILYVPPQTEISLSDILRPFHLRGCPFGGRWHLRQLAYCSYLWPSKCGPREKAAHGGRQRGCSAGAEVHNPNVGNDNP